MKVPGHVRFFRINDEYIPYITYIYIYMVCIYIHMYDIYMSIYHSYLCVFTGNECARIAISEEFLHWLW